jgi:eukaryotic-like serine/threonine-protein kinase
MSLKKQGKYRFQNFEIDLPNRSFRRDGQIIRIAPKTFDLLTFLVLNTQRTASKDELMRAVWPDSDAEESSLNQQILLLRKVLAGSESGDGLIISVPGGGYKFLAPVTEVSESQADSGERTVLRPVDSMSHHAVEEEIERDASGSPPPARDQDSSFFAGFGHPGSWHSIVATAILAAIGFGGLFGWRWMHRPATQSLTVVIADFENTTGNPQFDLALKTALTIDLQQSPLLAVSSHARIGKAFAEMKVASEQPLTPDLARDVCTRIQDQAYLTGSIRRFARKYMVAAEAFDCANGRSLAASKGLADSPDGIVAILDRVAVDLREQLGEPAKSIASFSKPLFGTRTASLEALKAYADASHLQLQGRMEDSVTLFQHAVEIDPEFALAFADLGVVHSDIGELDLAKTSLTRAYELRDTVDEPDRLHIIAAYNDIVTGDVQASIRNVKAWSEEYPRNPVPLIHLADLETQIGKAVLAIDPARRALELNAGEAFAYIVLARAQLHLGQFEQAAETCQLAIDRHLDGEQIHGFLFQIAFLRLAQAEMDKQIAWAKGQPGEPFMLSQLGLVNFALGKAKTAQAILQSALDEYRKSGQNGRADEVLAEMPRIEAELGLVEAARLQLARLPEAGESSTGAATDIPVAWAHAGGISRAQALLKQEIDAHLTSTLWQEDFAPQIKAAIDFNQQRPADAIEDLKPAIPYDLRSFDGPAVRGRAYLAAKQPELAEAEFHKILDHPGIDPLSHDYPLAQLGLARALAAQGKTVEAGFAYKVVLQIWKDADADLPRLKEAKAEFSRLAGEPVKTRPAVSAQTGHKPSAIRR